ncbi:MAG TPA: esterase-like activity of phytase family protein [Roseimicrobium sp.]|nr:esterase-like activity of phytase family protein [Roseimicrobium sp.]
MFHPLSIRLLHIVLLCLLGNPLVGGCQSADTRPVTNAPARNEPVRTYTLKADHTWQLDAPSKERFDASALLWTADGKLLTVNDRSSTLYEILLDEKLTSATLQPVPNAFTATQLAPFKAEKKGRYDCEGIAQDSVGHLYVCEEANRWILRWDPKTRSVERLPIDWKSVEKYFSPMDSNASFEGVAIGDRTLYVANERSRGRIIEVNLDTMQVIGDFSAQIPDEAAYDVHYSDLCWFEGHLYVLLRESWRVLKVDLARRRTVTVYSFSKMEQDPETFYRNPYPTSTMEGLAVDKNYIWLATDNNGQPRLKYPNDTRPTLFRCPRPDRTHH